MQQAMSIVPRPTTRLGSIMSVFKYPTPRTAWDTPCPITTLGRLRAVWFFCITFIPCFIHAIVDTIYQLEIFPTIFSVSPQVSGFLGGQTLTITGSGFNADCSDTVVSLGGAANCSITSCSDSVITCVAGSTNSAAAAPFLSTPGLLLRLWFNFYVGNSISAFALNSKYPSQPDFTEITLNGLQVWTSRDYLSNVQLNLFSGASNELRTNLLATGQLIFFTSWHLRLTIFYS